MYAWIFFLVKHLIEAYKLNPEVKDRHGQTPLHYASEKGYLDIVKYLVEECKCNPDEKDGQGQTPLYWASCGGHSDIVQYLIEECRATITEKIIEEIKYYLLEQQKKQKSNQNQ